jgi:soluble lytic murein transglycosylase-like protein
MQESLKYREKRTELYARYKKELLKKGTDDRLDPQKSIKHGFKYFSSMMEQQKGDISLALASYNSGPHRIKQYKGIPPYAETVNFRNRVLKYYKNYLRKLNIYQGGCQEGLEKMTFRDDREVSEMSGIGQKYQ